MASLHLYSRAPTFLHRTMEEGLQDSEPAICLSHGQTDRRLLLLLVSVLFFTFRKTAQSDVRVSEFEVLIKKNFLNGSNPYQFSNNSATHCIHLDLDAVLIQRVICN